MLKLYPKLNGPPEQRGFSLEEVKQGDYTLYMDIICYSCGKEQSVASTGYIGGPCIRCGKNTLPKYPLDK